MTGSAQFRLSPEGAHKCGAALHRARMASDSMRKITQEWLVRSNWASRGV